MPEFQARTEIPVPVSVLAAWHERPGAFERLTPPWEDVTVLSAPDAIEDGAELVLDVAVPGKKLRWVSVHEDCRPGEQFCDRQKQGPFKSWHHTHKFVRISDNTSAIEDTIHYELPAGPVAQFLAGGAVEKKLARGFAYRHEILKQDFKRYFDANGPIHQPKVILLTGATGMIGSELRALLSTLGHTVYGITRSPKSSKDIAWDPAAGQLDLSGLPKVDACIHLAGENIAEGTWTATKKKRILESRTQGTALLAEALAKLDPKPEVFVSASASGYYPIEPGKGVGPFDENGPAGNSFLASVCQQWEAAAEAARDGGIRVVHPRIGVVLSPAGGALAKMLPIFRTGMGGKVGDGRQHLSWATTDDVLDILYRCVWDESLEGPVNAVVPHPITNADFSAKLGHVLGRPAVLPAPAFAINMAFGQMGKETVLADTNVIPAKLIDRDHEFRYPVLEDALKHVLG